MADAVQQRVEAGLEELHALTQRQVLSEEETRQILRRRRDFEFECSSRHGDTVRAFLLYIRYEVNLLTLLRLRCRAALDANRSRQQQLQQQQRLLRVKQQQAAKKEKKAGTRKQREKLERELKRQQQQQQRQQRRILRAKDLLHAVVRTGSRRVYRLCRRLLQRHSTSLALWYSCLDLLLQLGSTRQLQQLLLHALRQFPCCSGLWILAADRLLQQGQLLAARRLLLTALRFSSNSVALWTELLRLEAAAVLQRAKALRSQHHEQQLQRQQGKSCRTPSSASAALDEERELKMLLEEPEATANAVERDAATPAEAQAGAGEAGAGTAAELPQVQGDAILVVLKTAAEKLRQRPRKARESPAAAVAEVTACNSRSNSSGLAVAAVDSRLQDFLIRALELCLGLQASDLAPLMQQQLLPPLQQQVSLLLHEQAQQQPLLRVYEWKVLLLQAVAAASSNQAAEETADACRSSRNTSRSSIEVEGSSGKTKGSRNRKGPLFQTLESILKECETQPHLLLLLALLLHALHSSSSSSKAPPAAAETASAAGEGRAGDIRIQETGDEILCVLDVEGDAGDAEGVTHAVSGYSSSSSRKTEAIGGGEGGGGGRGAAATVADTATELLTGAHLIQRYGGAHADADLFPRYPAASEDDAAAASEDEAAAASEAATVAKDAASAATGGVAREAAHDAFAQQQLEMLSEAGWPQVLLLLQRQPRIGRACLLLLNTDTTTKAEGASGAAAAATGDLLAEPQLLQLQRETLWAALWDSAAVPPEERDGQLHEQRLWLIQSLLRALQHVRDQQLLQKHWQGTKKGGKAAENRTPEQAPAAAAGAFVALGQLLQELLQRAAAHVQTSFSEEVRIHLEPLQQVQQKLQQLTESFLQQQRQLDTNTPSSRKQHQQQAAQLLLLLLEIRKTSLLKPVQQRAAQERQPSKKQKKQRQHEQEVAAENNERQRELKSTSDSTAAALDVLRKVKGSLGVPEAAALLQHCLLLFDQEQHSSSNKKVGSQEDTAAVVGREPDAVPLLPTWFQVLLAAAAPAALPVLVQRFCQHSFMQRRQQMQERFAQQQHQDEQAAVNWFEGLVSQQPYKRRKVLLAQQRLPPNSNTSFEMGYADAGATALPEGEAKKRVESRATKGSNVYAIAEVATVLRWSHACVSSLNDSFCCVRLCTASRLTVFIEMCDFAIRTLWRSITYCWMSAAAAVPTLWAGASPGWPDMLRVLLQQSREVYACALAGFERCGVQQQVLMHEEKWGRGRRLQQQEEVLCQHVLQHVTDACQQQVQWWVDFWRFSRFCEEAANLLHLQQSSCSHLSQKGATALLTSRRKTSTANGLTGAPFVVEKREEAERRAEQALGEGSAALAAFREAVAVEVATPCTLRQHYPGGCTTCGVNRLWCTYTAAASPTSDSVATSVSSA